MSADGISKGAARMFSDLTWPHGLEWTIKGSSAALGAPYVYVSASIVDRTIVADGPNEQRHDLTVAVDASSVPPDLAEGYGYAVAAQCVADIVNRMGKAGR